MISLGSLATKLSHHRHDSSESSDLQKVMMQLANRWKSIKEKCVPPFHLLIVCSAYSRRLYIEYSELRTPL